MFGWALKKILGTSHEREIKRLRPRVEAINALEDRVSKMTDAELRAKSGEFKEKLDNGATLDDILHEAFAICREGGKRALRMRHYDVQLIGGMVLHSGKIAEMRTGEGKTLVATLACYLNALEGKGVHVVTVNDYLAKRDAEWMGRLYGFLGLETGVIHHSQEDSDKIRAYRSDITYGQNNEFGFDYLRDHMKYSALSYTQRPLNYAIVDEVDSILIDEARTPLIISGHGVPSSHKYKDVNEMIPRLRKDEHYVVDEKGHSVSLTDEGVDAAQKLLGIENLYDPVNLEVLHIMNQCLRAHALYKRDVNYLVAADGKVLIIDEFTGRVLPGRRWSDGLHQAVEAKEHVRVQEENRTVATITFQNLFRLYKKLSGMTGTADTEAGEFHSTYKLDVVIVPTNKPILRDDFEDVVYKTEREKFAAVAAEIIEFHERGQPVLVGTTSVEKSAAVAKILEKRKIPHAVLNAKQHELEAYVVAQAGRRAAITVSTNMAGRGTDILLGGNAEMIAKLEFKEAGRDPDLEPEAFKELVDAHEVQCKEQGEEIRRTGGLHIIGTERHESRRIDNQLRGRAGRQGDKGSSRFYLSLEDDLMRIFGGERVKLLMDRMGMPDNEPIVHPWVSKSIQDAQSKVEARNFDIRKHTLEYDDVMSDQRKAVYALRHDLLAGTYEPDELDEEGKATGKKRKIVAGTEYEGLVHSIVEQMVLSHSTPDELDAPRPEKIDEAKKIYDIEGLKHSIYAYFGYFFEHREAELNRPQQVYERLLAEVPQSLSAQRERLLDLMDQIIAALIETTCKPNVPAEDWDVAELQKAFREHFGVAAPEAVLHLTDVEQIAKVLYRTAEESFVVKENRTDTRQLMRGFAELYLREIDKQWVDHLTNMEHLRDGIGLRGYGQRDPKQEYKKEGFEIFVNMMASLRSAVCTQLFSAGEFRDSDIESMMREDQELEQARMNELVMQHGGEVAAGDEGEMSFMPREAAQPAVQSGDECPCGSGQLFKECHGAAA